MMNSPRALIVEDEEPFRKVVAEILQGAGYEVTLCASGTQAIAFTTSRAFDVVISDGGRDGMSGLQCREGLSLLAFVAKHRDEDARLSQVGGGLDAGHRHEADPRVLELTDGLGQNLSH